MSTSTNTNYFLSSCSTADLSKEQFESRDIRYLCFHFSLDGVEYEDDLGQSIPFDEFYQRMVDGEMTKTSQPSVEQYVEHFTKMLEEGKDILHLTLSTGISGAYNSATVARDLVSAQYPDRKIVVIDSLAASSGQGLLMWKLADLRDEGMGFDEICAWAEEHRLNLHHWFFTTDLTFFIRGGRVSKTAGTVAQVLNICPLLNVDYQGHLTPREKIRTKKRVIKTIVQRMVEHAEDGLDYSGKCFISNSACHDDARAVADLIEKTFPKLDGKVVINSVGTTIGSHTGPGTVALFFWGDKRVD
ncbi:MAG: DegV family protein [Coriobacteriales bacterium]|jgi:DegV family protein with EDD domain|nr:DegV family protein [Coriobacteriales bacterium]